MSWRFFCDGGVAVAVVDAFEMKMPMLKIKQMQKWMILSFVVLMVLRVNQSERTLCLDAGVGVVAAAVVMCLWKRDGLRCLLKWVVSLWKDCDAVVHLDHDDDEWFADLKMMKVMKVMMMLMMMMMLWQET
jgi:hypothetical protein